MPAPWRVDSEIVFFVLFGWCIHPRKYSNACFQSNLRGSTRFLQGRGLVIPELLLVASTTCSWMLRLLIVAVVAQRRFKPYCLEGPFSVIGNNYQEPVFLRVP